MSTAQEKQSPERIQAYFRQFRFLEKIQVKKFFWWSTMLNPENTEEIRVRRLTMTHVEASYYDRIRGRQYFIFGQEDADDISEIYEEMVKGDKRTLKERLLVVDRKKIGYVVLVERWVLDRKRFSVTVLMRPRPGKPDEFDLNDLPSVLPEVIAAREEEARIARNQQEIQAEIAFDSL